MAGRVALVTGASRGIVAAGQRRPPTRTTTGLIETTAADGVFEEPYADA